MIEKHYKFSGIDIRDPIPVVAPTTSKKVYSDADIVLSSDWVPPVTIVPTNVTATQPEDSPSSRKKTSSVSFSLDSSGDADNSQTSGKDDSDKHETKKNKVSADSAKVILISTQNWLI